MPINYRTFILIVFVVLRTFPCSAVGNSPVTYEVAREFFAYRGLFNRSEPLLSLYLSAASTSNDNTDRAANLIQKLSDPNILQKDLKLLKYQLRLSNDSVYRVELHRQLTFAFEHQQSIKSALEFRNSKKAGVPINAWNRNWQTGNLSYGIGFASALGASLATHLMGLGDAVSLITPIVTLPTIGLLSATILTHTGYVKAARETERAEENLKAVIQRMAREVTGKLGLPELAFGKNENSEGPMKQIRVKGEKLIEVIKLATHADGSPLLVRLQDLSDAVDFRNDLIIYRGVSSEIVENMGSQFYPSQQRNQSKNEWPLKSVSEFSRILIPVAYRRGGNQNTAKDRQIFLIDSLSKILKNEQIVLSQLVESTGTDSAVRATCVGLRHIVLSDNPL